MISFACFNLKHHNIETSIKVRYFFKDKNFVFTKNNFYLSQQSIDMFIDEHLYFNEKQILTKLYR